MLTGRNIFTRVHMHDSIERQFRRQCRHSDRKFVDALHRKPLVLVKSDQHFVRLDDLSYGAHAPGSLARDRSDRIRPKRKENEWNHQLTLPSVRQIRAPTGAWVKTTAPFADEFR